MKTLGARLVFYYCLVVTLTVGAALVVGFYFIQQHLVSGTDFLLDAEYEEVRGMLNHLSPRGDSNAVFKALQKHASIDASVFYFQVHNDADQLLFQSPNLEGHGLPDLGGPPASGGPRRRSVELEELGLIRLAEYYQNDLHVQIATSLRFLTSFKSRFYTVLSVALPAVLLLSLVVGFVLSEVTLRPLRLIQATARRIHASNLNERIPLPRGKDELARLAVLINDMLGRLEVSFNETRRLTAEMSHELRTPLSIIRLHAEKALQLPGLGEEAASELREIQDEIVRLDRIIDQLLILVRAEAQALPLRLETQDTRGFMEHFAEDASVLAESSRRRFQLRRNDDIKLAFDKGWIRQVLFNLLSNALKFSPPQSEVRLDSARRNGDWQVTFSDEGEGVPPEERRRIFEPFQQLPARGADDRGVKGAGLGLAVCKSIVELHRGEIYCSDNGNAKSFSITFRIPIEAEGLRGAFTEHLPPGGGPDTDPGGREANKPGDPNGGATRV